MDLWRYMPSTRDPLSPSAHSLLVHLRPCIRTSMRQHVRVRVCAGFVRACMHGPLTQAMYSQVFCAT